MKLFVSALLLSAATLVEAGQLRALQEEEPLPNLPTPDEDSFDEPKIDTTDPGALQCPPKPKCIKDGGEPRTFAGPRVRKEWRELSKEDVDKYACALQVLDTMKTKEGRECYGTDAYWSFPDLVVLHACVASDERGDQGHRSPGFMLFHKSYVLTFEEAILAVDPSIGAIPWWDMPLDSAPVLDVDGNEIVPAGKYYNTDEYIWSAKYFGEQTGSGPNFEVTNGRWAWRKMPRMADYNYKYWEKTKNVTNQCIASKFFEPRSPKAEDTLRKLSPFDDYPNQNCERCCNGKTAEGKDPQCQCKYPDDRVDIYMRGPTLDTESCSMYVTRNPNGRGVGTVTTSDSSFETADGWPTNGNGRSQQDSLLRYTQNDFDSCANSDNTRTWMEWQNCIEENSFGTLEGMYCPADKDMCTQSEMKKVYALHSSAHDKTLGEIGDVTTSPTDPALFFSYHAYIDKNYMDWQRSMIATEKWTDPGTKFWDMNELNKNHFGYPRSQTFEEWKTSVEGFEELEFIKGMVDSSNERMELHNYVVPVTWDHYDLMLWQDLLGNSDPATYQWPNASKSAEWRKSATMSDDDAIEIFKVHAGSGANLYDTLTSDDVYTPGAPNFLGPACSSMTNSVDKSFTSDGGATYHYFNPIFSSTCTAPIFPSPEPGSLTYNLTNGARTYATSGPFIYMTKYHPTDFFNRGKIADPTVAWVPGTTLDDIALGGLPFRNIFPTYDGGEFGYSNKELIEMSIVCVGDRSPDNADMPCSPYDYSS